MARLGKLVRHAAGDPLFRPGQGATALYLVVDGLAEICRIKKDAGLPEPVAYAGPGAVLAESKVITGTPFTALARFPEGGSTIQWPRAVVLRRLVASQDFSMQYLQYIAQRLEGSLSGLDAARSRLEGSLSHFDLPTILQTVVESGAQGVVEIRNSRGNLHGSMHMGDRLVGPIYCGTLSGVDAFLEMVVTPPEDATFSIDPGRPTSNGGARWQLNSLLFEGARISDEYRRFQSELDETTGLAPAARQPTLSGEVEPELVQQVWDLLQARSMGWGELARHIPRCRAVVALAVRDLLVTGSIQPTEGAFNAGSTGDDHD